MKNYYRNLKVLALAALALSLQVQAARAQVLKAQADLYNPKGDLVGRVVFTEDPAERKGVKVSVNIVDLTPGEHALHIHEKAECISPDFSSAGGHFNPYGAKHGFLNPEGPHAGDLPNIRVGSNGTAVKEFFTKRVTLAPGARNSLFHKEGTSVVIHLKPDDYITDPAGKGGSRIACGVIKRK
jgi:Cu-Zn family superoxide dismutase